MPTKRLSRRLIPVREAFGPLVRDELRAVVKAGTWIQVRWDDAPDSVELVVQLETWDEKYPPSIRICRFNGGGPASIEQDQVVACFGRVQRPDAIGV